MKKTSFLFVLLLFSLSVYSQFQLSGTVIDAESGDSLPGAIIQLNNKALVSISDASGNYHFKQLKPGNYKMKVTYLGYDNYNEEITISSDKTIVTRLKMKSINCIEIQIAATRVPVKAPASMKTITAAEIAERNTGQDLPYILESTPSTVSTSDGGTGIGYTGLRIRGSDMTRINVTVNGIPFNDPESHEVYWVDIPDIASSIDNIQVQRGVGTSSNGAASFGGSINIQTIPPGNKAYAEIDNSYGSYNSRRHAIKFGTGILGSKFAIDGRLSRIASDGYIDRATSDLTSLFLTGSYFGKKSLLRFNMISGHERTYQAWDGIPAEILDTNRTYNVNGLFFDKYGNIDYYKNEVDDYKQEQYHLVYTYAFSRKLNASATMHYTHGAGYYEQYKQDENFNDYLLNPVLLAHVTSS